MYSLSDDDVVCIERSLRVYCIYIDILKVLALFDYAELCALARNGVCLSVCLSVCRVPRSNSRTKRPRKPEIGRMEAHQTSNLII